MLEIPKERFVWEMSGANPPALEVEPGETVRLHCYDCYMDTIRENGQLSTSPGGNPACGPVFVRGAKPGDTIVAEVLAIRVGGEGTMVVYPGEGALGGAVTHVDSRKIAIDGDVARVGGVEVPLAPMIGVIGVAPAQGAVGNHTPGAHGGNMDDRRIGVGARVYLPVGVEGGLFALGDVHAQMGDGEVAICGLEVPAEVEVRLELIKGNAEAWPVVEREGSFAVNCSAKTLDEAAELARYALHSFLQKRTTLSANDIVMLLSLVGDLSICQVVDPLVTVRMGLRAGVLDVEF